MKANDIFDVAGGIVLVAIITAIVSSKNVAGQITATGNAFSNTLKAALGAGSVN